MAQIKSAQKRIRQIRKRTVRNQHLKRLIRNANQDLSTAVASRQADSIAQARSEYDRLIDRALKKKLIKKNKAARKKSQAAALSKSARRDQSAAPKSATKSAVSAAKPASKKTAPKPPKTQK